MDKYIFLVINLIKYMRFCTDYTKQKYSQLHNIDFLSETIPSDYERHPAWYKIKLTLCLFDKYDTIMYIDSDAGFVNFENYIDEYLTESFDIALAKTNERNEYWCIHS